MQRSMFVQKSSLPGTALRGAQLTVSVYSLKHKSPKLQNPACEGREVNMGKHLRKERISHGRAPATHSSVRPRVC